jgi:N-(2-amino-2-carboxyethyl)-L-glutamate synthase
LGQDLNNQPALIGKLVRIENVIRETPIVCLNNPAVECIDLYAKLEFFNGIGSIKDRPAFWILKRAIERGEIRAQTTVIESSSGNFACALSAFCRMLDLKFIPVIDSNVSPFYEAALTSQCEIVAKVTERDDTGGFLKTRLERVRQLLASNPNSYWTNQYENLDGMAAHYHLTGAEIERVPMDYIFLGISTAGTIAGVSQRLGERNPKARIVAVDVEGSVALGNPPKKRWLSGLGSSIVPPLLRQARIDDAVIVSEIEAISACHELLERHGLFVGASTGTVYAAIRKYFSGRVGIARPRVLFLCADRGTAYLHNVFDRRWAAWRESLDRPAEEALETNGQA